MDDVHTHAEKPRLVRVSKWLGIVAATLCGALIIWIVLLVVVGFASRDTPNALFGLGIVYMAMVPLAAIPALLACIVGTICAAIAIRKHPDGRSAHKGLWLSIYGAVALLVSYGLGFGLLILIG